MGIPQVKPISEAQIILDHPSQPLSILTRLQLLTSPIPPSAQIFFSQHRASTQHSNQPSSHLVGFASEGATLLKQQPVSSPNFAWCLKGFPSQ